MLMNRTSWKVSWTNPKSIYLYVTLFYKLSFRFVNVLNAVKKFYLNPTLRKDE